MDVFAHDGAWLARGAYSPASQIRVRAWSFERDVDVDAQFFEHRVRAAFERRGPILRRGDVDAVRLVHGESDGLPGLIVDRYGDVLVCQVLSAGVERWRDAVVRALQAQVPATSIYERSATDARRKEGLEPREGVVSGPEPGELVIREGESRYVVDVRTGHKTGFYLDQRDNRAVVAAHARDAELLNVFAYTGGFGIAALNAGARHVTHVETSGDALALARRNADLNGVPEDAVSYEQRDAFELLRAYRDAGRTFDLVVLDPPKFADSKAQLAGAARGYKDINLLAFKLLRPGGTLFTFSCSGVLKADLFQKIVADAALDAGREAVVLQHLEQAPDHPVALPFPEGAYLKGLACRVA